MKEHNDNLVEYRFLRPQALVERRDAMPVAYMGLGVFECHGLHNPLGLDGIKANGIACHLAKKLGGIVMPTIRTWDEAKGGGFIRGSPAMPLLLGWTTSFPREIRFARRSPTSRPPCPPHLLLWCSAALKLYRGWMRRTISAVGPIWLSISARLL